MGSVGAGLLCLPDKFAILTCPDSVRSPAWDKNLSFPSSCLLSLLVSSKIIHTYRNFGKMMRDVRFVGGKIHNGLVYSGNFAKTA